jgi:hypothetical protein
MAEIEKLSLQDVRLIAHHVPYGGIGVAALAEKHPWIREYSQEAIREIYGDQFPAWKWETLPVHADRWVGAIGVVTTNPRRMWAEIVNDRTFSWGLTMKTVDREQVVMRYELTPERVIVYMPALIQVAMDMFGDSLKHWKADRGVSLHKVFIRSLYEHEEENIVADLRGLTPSIMDFRIGKKQWKPKSDVPGVLDWFPGEEEGKAGDIWWWNKGLVRDIIFEWTDKGPDAFAKDLITSGGITLNDEWTEDRVIEFFRDVYRKIGEFFAP